jgi:peptidoglycan hydrolase-like protein with peptidoglycan-binding domain
MFRKLLILVSVSFLFAGISFAQGDSAKPAATATTASTTKTAAFRPNKDQVMQGQKFLKDAKLYTGDATGIYNDDTRAAIRTYQKNNGLTISGNFNRATLEKMNIALTDKQKGIESPAATTKTATTKTIATTGGPSTTTTSDAPKRPAPFRASADQIKAAQKMLRDGKMLTGGEDGKLDDPTREGLKKYQEANKIKANGTLNAETLNKMGIALTDKQKEQVAAQAAYDAAKTPKN